MAWRCSGSTNAELIANLQASGLVKSARVAAAMANVDRKHYCPIQSVAYQDSPQPIGHGATISAPHMHAAAMEHLAEYISRGARVLDVGSGSGYLLAVLHEMAKTGIEDGRGSAQIIGIEHVHELVDMSVRNLKADRRSDTLASGVIKVVTGDGRLGHPSGAPYDCIHVGAAAPTMPHALIDQLASPGRMFIPLGTNSQSIVHVDKSADGVITQRNIMGVRYVPLCDRAEQTSF